MSTTQIIILTAAVSVLASAVIGLFLYNRALKNRSETDAIEAEAAAFVGALNDAAQ